MFEFKKLCNSFENANAVEKGALIAEMSAVISYRLKELNITGTDPMTVLAGFIIGSVVADGKVNEQEYLLIYPALVRTFGDGFDFNSVKVSFEKDKSSKNAVTEYTEKLLQIFVLLDEDIKEDIIKLCLCVVSIDGKITLREKKHIKRLCR